MQTQEHLVIADLGCARHYSTPHALVQDTLGSPAFWSPDCLEQQPKSQNLGLDLGEEESGAVGYSPYLLDNYALGVCIYVLLTSYLPYHADDVLTMFHRICHDDLSPFPSSHMLGMESIYGVDTEMMRMYGQPLVQGLMSKDAAERWSLGNAMDYLSSFAAA